jgi:hypothetical protein
MNYLQKNSSLHDFLYILSLSCIYDLEPASLLELYHTDCILKTEHKSRIVHVQKGYEL